MLIDREVSLHLLRSRKIANLVRLSIECECCFKWEHRACAGISEDEYEIIGNDPSPNIMFFCSICWLKVSMALKFFNEIKQTQKSLDDKVKQFEEKITLLTSSQAASSIANSKVVTAQSLETLSTNTIDVSVVQPDITNKSAAPPKPPLIVLDSRYNVVLYRIVEDTPRTDRQKHDLDHLLNVLSSIDGSLTAASIQDFHRLGKFKPSNICLHPLLVKFLRIFEASMVLFKKDSLTSS